MMSMKTCRQCQTVKPLDDFHRNRGMADGHRNDCKICSCTYQKLRYRENMKGQAWLLKKRQRARLYARRRWREDSAYRADRRDCNRQTTRVRAREERRAHNAVRRAVRHGQITRPDNCERCGHDFSEFRCEAHHKDYSKPLNVEWLCGLCHGKQHRKVA